MIKEFLIYLKISHVIDKEVYLKTKLAKHQCKMTSVHEKYKDMQFKNGALRCEFNYLHNELMKRWYEKKIIRRIE